MMKLSMVLCGMVLALGAGCGPPTVSPYDSCVAGDVCSVGGQVCAGSTLPASSYTGAFCTSGCTSDADCYQDFTSDPAVCVLYAAGAGQCYLSCVTNISCPYGQACFTYPDAFTGQSISLCTP